jgi:hypothetical protein
MTKEPNRNSVESEQILKLKSGSNLMLSDQGMKFIQGSNMTNPTTQSSIGDFSAHQTHQQRNNSLNSQVKQPSKQFKTLKSSVDSKKTQKFTTQPKTGL